MCCKIFILLFFFLVSLTSYFFRIDCDLQVCILWCSVTTREFKRVLATSNSGIINAMLRFFFEVRCNSLKHIYHTCRFYCQTWFMLMMMNHLWMPRLTFLGICVFGVSELILAVVHNSPGVNLLLQEDGSLPDRDQVRTMFSLLSSWVFCSLFVSALVVSCSNFLVWIYCFLSSKFFWAGYQTSFPFLTISWIR